MLGSSYSAVQIVFFAALLSFPILALLVLRDPAGGSLWPRNPGWVFLRTATSVITTVAAFHAFGTLPLAQTYAILFAIPLIITLLSIPILGETVRLRRWVAVIVGLIGVLIVLRPEVPPFPPDICRRLSLLLQDQLRRLSCERSAIPNGRLSC